VKVLIIAGPYEADRLRRAAVSAGFETVAVEPGESLSGWISGSRPDLIVMAPKIVNPDPAVALAKVRAIPRGRVPIFLVGDVADEAQFKGLADGFFVRPVSAADLIGQARALLSASGPPATPKSGPHALKAPPNLKPLVAAGDAGPARASSGSGPLAGPTLVNLDEGIDDLLDADLREALRGMVPGRERIGTPVGRPQHAATATDPSATVAAPGDGEEAASADKALAELRDESSQKTLEVPREVVARMASADSASGEAGSDRPRAAESTPGPLRLAPQETGELTQQDMAALLGRIHVEGLTGWLTIRRDDVEKAIVFDRGAPILAGSNVAADRLGDMLVRQGRLSAAQQAQCVATLIATRRRLGAILVEAGFIKASELAPLVRRHFEEIIYSLFAWETGTWSLSPDRPEKEENIQLTEHPAALIIEGLRRKYGTARLRARLGSGHQVLRVVREARLSALLDRMGLTEDERGCLAWFDGLRSLDEIRLRGHADENALLAVTLALVVLGRLQAVSASGDSDPAPAPPGDGEPTGAGKDRERERDREIDRARILARYALVREGDYFQLLGVSRDATLHELRRAHQTLVRDFSRQGLAQELAAELGPELVAVRAVIEEGLRVLADPRLRQRYQAHLPSPPERTQ
jgi:hypothetical protein